MEIFFAEVAKVNAMPPQDPAFWRQFGMDLVRPALGGGVGDARRRVGTEWRVGQRLAGDHVRVRPAV
jgi:hypothetical protein